MSTPLTPPIPKPIDSPVIPVLPAIPPLPIIPSGGLAASLITLANNIKSHVVEYENAKLLIQTTDPIVISASLNAAIEKLSTQLATEIVATILSQIITVNAPLLGTATPAGVLVGVAQGVTPTTVSIT